MLLRQICQHTTLNISADFPGYDPMYIDASVTHSCSSVSLMSALSRAWSPVPTPACLCSKYTVAFSDRIPYTRRALNSFPAKTHDTCSVLLCSIHCTMRSHRRLLCSTESCLVVYLRDSHAFNVTTAWLHLLELVGRKIQLEARTCQRQHQFVDCRVRIVVLINLRHKD